MKNIKPQDSRAQGVEAVIDWCRALALPVTFLEEEDIKLLYSKKTSKKGLFKKVNLVCEFDGLMTIIEFSQHPFKGSEFIVVLDIFMRSGLDSRSWLKYKKEILELNSDELKQLILDIFEIW